MSTSSVPSTAVSSPGESPGFGRSERRGRGPSALPAAALLLTACLRAAAGDPGPAGTVRICLSRSADHEPWALTVEIADTESLRAQGLMDRVSLPADAGMLFRYPRVQPPGTGFWMPRVPFPLDIAFLDADGVVLAVRTMPPCPHPEQAPCPIYPAGVRFIDALEVNGGALETHGVRAGQSRVTPCPDERPRAELTPHATDGRDPVLVSEARAATHRGIGNGAEPVAESGNHRNGRE